MPDPEVVPEPDEAPGAGLPRRPVLSVLVTIAGLVLAGLTGASSASLAADATSGTSAWPSVLVWSLLPAAVLAIGLRTTLQTFARRTVGWLPLLLVGYVLALLLVGVPTALAT
jgi:hypothetical protein